jgi:prophage regulatory protein
MSSEPLDRLLTIKKIAAQTGISRSTIYRRMREGGFPKPLRIGPRATRWPESAIKVWLDGLRSSDGV